MSFPVPTPAAQRRAARRGSALVLALGAAALLLGGCAGMSRQSRDTAIGASVGAVAGQVITGNTAGAAVGAAIGGVIGHQNTSR